MSLTHFRRTAEQWFPSGRLEDQVRRVAGALPAAVALINRERRIVFHDGDWSEWVGDRQIDGRTLADLFEVADYESFRHSVDEALSGQRVRIEAWVPWAVGGPRHFELIFLPQASVDGGFDGMIALAFNTTERIHREEVSSFLLEAGDYLSGSLDFEEILGRLASLALPRLGDACLIDLPEPEGAHRRIAWSILETGRLRRDRDRIEGPGSSLRPQDGAGLSPQTGVSRLFPEIGLEPMFSGPVSRELSEIFPFLKRASGLTVPLPLRGQAIGVLSLFRVMPGRLYGPEDLHLAERLGRKAASALENARTHRELRREVERRSQEEILIGSCDSIRLAVEIAQPATWDFEFRSGAFTWNERCRALWNAPASSSEDWEAFLDGIHPEDRPGVEPVLRGLQQSDPSGNFRLQFRTAARGGFPERWISALGRVFFDGAGRPLKLIGAAVEITERKRAEKDLLLKNSLLRSQTEAAIDGVLVVDPSGRILSYNRRFMEMWGIPPEVLETRMDASAIATVLPRLADPEGFIARVQELYDHPTAESRDEIVFKDGRTFDRYSAPVRGPDGVYYGRVWYFRDITETKHQEAVLRESAERLQEALGDLDSFVYTVAHDLRAPLRAMAGFCQALQEDYAPELDPMANEYVGRIGNAARRMDRLIQDLLCYCRLARDKIELEKIELGPLVDEVLAGFDHEFRERGAQVDAASPLHPVLAHRVALGQVLSNLISNAVKFVAPGCRPLVRIHSELRRGRVRLWVEDSGIGIAPEHRDRIFGVFQRLHSAADYPGTGIGLAIVKRAVERMGGRVGVEGAAGQGSRFWIELRSAS